MCKKNCLGCQFLCVYGDHQTLGHWCVPLAQKDRSKIIETNSFFWIQSCKVDYRTYLCCHKGVWDEDNFIRAINRTKNLNATQESQLREKLLDVVISIGRNAKNPRGNSCFYRKFQEGMLLPAAEELEQRQTIQKEAAADRKWIKWGVWATFTVAFATFFTAPIGHYLSVLIEKMSAQLSTPKVVLHQTKAYQKTGMAKKY